MNYHALFVQVKKKNKINKVKKEVIFYISAKNFIFFENLYFTNISIDFNIN